MGQAERAIRIRRFQLQRDRFVIRGNGVVIFSQIEIGLAEVQISLSILGAHLDCLLIRRGRLVVFAGVEEIVALLVKVFRVYNRRRTAVAITGVAAVAITGIAAVVIRGVAVGIAVARTGAMRGPDHGFLIRSSVYVWLVLHRGEDAFAQLGFNIGAGD